MSSPVDLYVNNDTYVTLTGLQNGSDDSYLNSATVTATLKDLSGTEVTGASFPVTLSYESGSNGNYSGVIDKAVVLTVGAVYFLEVTAAESGIDGFWRVPMRARYREK